MYANGDGDDYDFTPSETSKLASLFGPLQTSIDTDLTYTAPKQPLKSKEEQNESKNIKQQSSTKVLIAKVVNLWKLEDKTYKALGKHGLGIIGSADSKVQELIAYKSKDNIILRANISDKFLFFIQKENFSSFHDNNAQNWLVKFENDDQNEFTIKLKSFGSKIIDSINQSSAIVPKTPETKIKPDILPKPQEKEAGDQDSDSSEKRASILHRITKLGQQTVLRPISTASDTSDHEDVIKNKKLRKPKKLIEKNKLREESATSKEGPQLTDPSCDELQGIISKEITLSNFNTMSENPSIWLTNQPNISNILLNQNLELKHTLSTIAFKLDSITSSKNDISNNSVAIAKIKALELKIDNLESACNSHIKKYDTLEAKYLNLLEKCNDEIEGNDTVLKKMESQIKDLQLEIDSAKEEIAKLNKQNEEYESTKKTLEEYDDIIQQQKSRINELEELCNKNKDFVENKEVIDSLTDTVDSLNRQLKIAEEKLVKTESEQEHMSRKKDVVTKNIGNVIKLYMNEMYQNILSNFNEDYSYSYDEIKEYIAENIKGFSLKLIEDVSDGLQELNPSQ